MSRAKVAREITRKAEALGKPDHKIVLTMGTALVFDKMLELGPRGITTRDLPGWDLRHYLRVMRRKGIGIDRKWEKHEGGQHGRWSLRAGHTSREIPYPEKTKPAAAATARASNSLSQTSKKEDLNDA